MGTLFYIMGKSASGKDSIYQKLQKKEELKLNSLVLYTTRPIRENETDGVEYHFVTEEKLEELEKAGIQEGDTVRMYGFDFDYYK